MIENYGIRSELEARPGRIRIFGILEELEDEVRRIGILLDRGIPNAPVEIVLMTGGDPALALLAQRLEPCFEAFHHLGLQFDHAGGNPPGKNVRPRFVLREAR